MGFLRVEAVVLCLGEARPERAHETFEAGKAPVDADGPLGYGAVGLGGFGFEDCEGDGELGEGLGEEEAGYS